MSTNDVPGYNPVNKDTLAMGAWAEHSDGSLILVESVEVGKVIFSIFDTAQDPPVEYRDAMPEGGFKQQFSFDPVKQGSEQWTWHDKTPFPWSRVMRVFPAGQKAVQADDTLNAAQRVAKSLNLRAGQVIERHHVDPTAQRAATKIMEGFRELLDSFAK